MPSPRPLILRASPSGDAFFGNDGDVLTCQGGDVWEAEPAGNVSGFTPRGTGAHFKTFFSTDQNLVWVTDFMTDAEQTDCFNGTLLNDFTPIIQLAIDFALYRNQNSGLSGGPRVRLPGGVMRVDGTIQVGYGTGIGPFRGCIFEGEGMRFGGNNGNQGSGTALVTTNKNAPAIAIQGGYYTQIRNLSLFGPNQDYIVHSVLNSPSMADLNVSHWIDPTFPASASTRFAVQCGIAIDPYSGPQPATHYPDVNYPSFLGAQTQYNKTPSSNVKLENLYIAGYVAGVALQPCNSDANGDFIRLENVTFFFSAYCFVWGNSQARVTTLDNCTFLGIHTGIDNVTFGFAGGNAQILLKSASFAQTIRMVNMDTQNVGGQAPHFLHCFAESTYSIGTIGVNADNAGATYFENCEFGMSAWETYGVPTYILANGARRAMISFKTCTFFVAGFVAINADYWGSIHFSSGGLTENANVYSFEDCSTSAFAFEASQLWQKCALNATAGMTVSNLSTTFERYSWRITRRYNLDTGANLSSALYGRLNPGDRVRCLPAYGPIACGSSFGADPGVPLTWRSASGWTAVGATTQTGRNISFTASGFSADSAQLKGGEPGDIMECLETGAVFWVYSRTAAVISARAMCGFDSSGNLLTVIPNNANFVGLNTRRYCPGIVGGDLVIYGDFAAGNPVVSNVVNGQGAFFTIANVISVGDWFFQQPSFNQLFVNDAATKITAIDDVAHTITFAGNATQTLVHQRLALFTRAPMPNGTPTP